MSRRFPNLQFAPVHLRSLLRRRLERGERLIAWGVGSTPIDASASIHLVAHTLPVVGPAMAAAAAASHKRLVIVTSRRVIIVLNKQPKKLRQDQAVCFECPHEYLGLTRKGRRRRRYEFRAPGLDQPLRVTLDRLRSKPGERLDEALAMLLEDPSRRAAPGPGWP